MEPPTHTLMSAALTTTLHAACALGGSHMHGQVCANDCVACCCSPTDAAIHQQMPLQLTTTTKLPGRRS
eukprot:365022-Chlamydomonas_euryale.AAC.10